IPATRTNHAPHRPRSAACGKVRPQRNARGGDRIAPRSASARAFEPHVRDGPRFRRRVDVHHARLAAHAAVFDVFLVGATPLVEAYFLGLTTERTGHLKR